VLYPLTFQPIFKPRVWGGRNLERLFAKPLPPGEPVGESWEISDRPGDVSVVARGPLAGKTLRWLMEQYAPDVLGPSVASAPRFPLLVKILDAQETLSLQVHPPATVAPQLGGEPKTEMWYIIEAAPGAEVMAGLKHGVTRAAFEQALRLGTAAECVHRISAHAGDVLFLPSGRLHALGAGLVLFEIQQNSDTTYRVFDWNRVGLNGKPRALHVTEAMASMDFDDVEPTFIQSRFSRNASLKVRYLVDDPLFKVDAWQIRRGLRFYLRSEEMQILGLCRGELTVRYDDAEYRFQAGDFVLIPACLARVAVVAVSPVELLHVQLGTAPS
jgi:mannose-6-phosphate isomerase